MVHRARRTAYLAHRRLPAVAQVVELVSSGDATKHSGRVVGIEAVCSTEFDQFSVLARTDHPDLHHRQVISWNAPHAWEPAGSGPGGRLIDRLRGIGCDSGGHSLVILDGPDADVLYLFNEAYERNLLITGWPATDMGLPAATTYARFDRVSTKNRRFVLRGQLQDGNGERLDFISKGEARMLIPNHILIATEGDNMPQLGLPLTSILGHEWGAATDDEHRVIWTGVVDAGGGDLRTAAFLAKK